MYPGAHVTPFGWLNGLILLFVASYLRYLTCLPSFYLYNKKIYISFAVSPPLEIQFDSFGRHRGGHVYHVGGNRLNCQEMAPLIRRQEV